MATPSRIVLGRRRGRKRLFLGVAMTIMLVKMLADFTRHSTLEWSSRVMFGGEQATVDTIDPSLSLSLSAQEKRSRIVFGDKATPNTIKNHHPPSSSSSSSSSPPTKQHQEAKKKIKLIHVVSPFVVHNKSDEYYPLDRDQWAAMVSIERARRHLPDEFMEVDFVCATMESDQKALSNLPCRQVLLTRSTKSEYPNILPPKEFPFIKDMLDASLGLLLQQQGRGNKTNVPLYNIHNDDFWWMLTNSDIGLTKQFYEGLPKYMETLDAFSINRVTIHIGNLTLSATSTKNDFLDQLDLLIHGGSSHPGKDCFLLRSSVLRKINFGNFFLGHPPWGNSLHHALGLMSKNKNIASNIHGTFHVGNDRKWSFKGKARLQSNDTESLEDFERCKESFKPTTEYGIQNRINCGKWYQPNRFVQDGNESVPIPAFVQEGYEEHYLSRRRQRIKRKKEKKKTK